MEEASKVEEKFPNPDVAADVSADSYEDITTELDGWLKRVPVGHTFLASGFTLEDAMHGWEVLSPKMDTGVGYASTKLCSEVEARDLSETEVLGVMDRVLSLELVLYRGYTAAHTVGTCHLLSAIGLARDKTLHLYLRAVLSCIQAVVEIVRHAEISFEEEFIRIAPDFNLDQADEPAARPALLKELQAAESSLASEAKAGNAHAHSLRLRMSLRRAMLELLSAAVKPGPMGGLKERAAAMTSAMSKLSGLLVPEKCPEWTIEEFLVRRDLGNATPARAIPKLDGPECFAEVGKLAEDFVAVSSCPELPATLDEVLSFACGIASRGVGVVVRSALRRFLSDGERILGVSAGTACAGFLTQLKVPRHYLSDDRATKQNLVGAQTVTVQHLLMYLCVNAARQRRRLRGLLRECGPMLPVCAELDRLIATDVERRTRFFQFFTAAQMVINSAMALQYLRLGAQLRLYETDELESVYWTMAHISKELDNWKEPLEAVKVKEEKKVASSGGKKKGAPAKGKASAAAVAVTASKAKIVTHLDMVRQAEALVAKSYFLLLVAANISGHLAYGEYPLQPSAQRWSLRMGCLAALVGEQSFAGARAAESARGAAALRQAAAESARAALLRLEGAAKSRNAVGGAATGGEAALRDAATAAASALASWPQHQHDAAAAAAAANHHHATLTLVWTPLHPLFPLLGWLQ